MRQEKDPELSKTRRENGNQAFQVMKHKLFNISPKYVQAGDMHQAMVNYSKAVVLAR